MDNILTQLLESSGHNHQLYEKHINPHLSSYLKSINYDKCYVKAKGSYLWDHHGQKYLDMISGYGVFALGRNNSYIKQSLIDFISSDMSSLVQLEASLPAGLLAKKIKQHLPPNLEYVYFTNSGAEGIETAIKYARCATSRPRILSASGSYHGSTMGALSINGWDSTKELFKPLLPKCTSVSFNDLSALENELTREDVAAYIVEPIQGEGPIPDAGYLKKAAQLCRNHGTLFIVDEVLTGIGRTGRFLAVEHDGDVNPDIVVLSKALSGGYVPVGAVISTKFVYDRVFSSIERAEIHSSTFGQGSLAMVAGLAILNYLDRFNIIDNVTTTSNILGSKLLALKDRYKSITNVYWKGLILEIVFSFPKGSRYRSSTDIVKALMQNHNVIVRKKNNQSIMLLPALVIESPEIEYFTYALEQVIATIN